MNHILKDVIHITIITNNPISTGMAIREIISLMKWEIKLLLPLLMVISESDEPREVIKTFTDVLSLPYSEKLRDFVELEKLSISYI